MGDRSYMSMKFGGPIKRATLLRLCEENGVASEFGSDDAEPWEEGDDGLLFIGESDVNGGGYFDFEVALVEAGIAFDRHSDGCGGAYGASIAYHRPGLTNPRKGWNGTPGIYEASTSDDDYEPLLQLSEVRKHLQAGDLQDWLDAEFPVIPPLTPVVWDETPEPPCVCGEARTDCDGSCPEGKAAAAEERLA